MRDGLHWRRGVCAPDSLRRVDGVHAAATLALRFWLAVFLTSDFRSFMLRSASHSRCHGTETGGGMETVMKALSCCGRCFFRGGRRYSLWRFQHESDALFPLTLASCPSLWLRCCYLLCCGPIRSCVFSSRHGRGRDLNHAATSGADLTSCCSIWVMAA